MIGILPLWKEKGMTSHDCVFKLRKILSMKRIGHTGTLDPNVEGVLPVCLGQATKIAEYITDAGKEYIAEVSIGKATTTEDADGEIVDRDDSYKEFSRTEIEEVLHQLTGDIEQTPPMYSAVKVNGRRLYEYAMKGIKVERPSRIVSIYAIELLDDKEKFDGTDVKFRIRVSCGKGTYIRTLSVQIGEMLGYPAHMSQLERTVSGNFRKEDCLTLSEVDSRMKNGTLQDYVLSLETALQEFPSVLAEGDLLYKVKNGQVLPADPLLCSHEKMVFLEGERAIAVYTKHPEREGMMKPEKMFPDL